MERKGRVAAASAAALVLAGAVASWQAKEGLSLTPIIPVQGDVPTIGHGATFYEDGTRVTMADPPITRERAHELAVFHISDVFMKCVVDSLGDTPVYEAELSTAVSFAGQYGCAAWRNSSMLRNMKAGNYTAACNSYLGYKYMTDSVAHKGWEPYVTGGRTRYRFDCSTPGNKICRGVWTRQLERQQNCLGAG